MNVQNDISKIQKRIFENKVKQGFNTKKIEPELLYLTEELGEAVAAYRRDKIKEFIDEIVDVIIYGLGLLAILKVDASKEILKKLKINEKRHYSKTSKKGWGHIDLTKTKY